MWELYPKVKHQLGHTWDYVYLFSVEIQIIAVRGKCKYTLAICRWCTAKKIILSDLLKCLFLICYYYYYYYTPLVGSWYKCRPGWSCLFKGPHRHWNSDSITDEQTPFSQYSPLWYYLGTSVVTNSLLTAGLHFPTSSHRENCVPGHHRVIELLYIWDGIHNEWHCIKLYVN